MIRARRRGRRAVFAALISFLLLPPTAMALGADCYACGSACEGSDCTATDCISASSGGCDCTIKRRRIGSTEIFTCLTSGFCTTGQASICPGDNTPPATIAVRGDFPLVPLGKTAILRRVGEALPELLDVIAAVIDRDAFGPGVSPLRGTIQTGIRDEKTGRRRYSRPVAFEAEVDVLGDSAYLDLRIVGARPLKVLGRLVDGGRSGELVVSPEKGHRPTRIVW